MVEYGIKIHTGDLAVDYGDVDLYLVGCGHLGHVTWIIYVHIGFSFLHVLYIKFAGL